MGAVHRHAVKSVVFAFVFSVFWTLHRNVTAVAVCTTQHDAGIGVHRMTISAGVARNATLGLLVGVLDRLAFGCRRMADVFDVQRFNFCRAGKPGRA